MNPCFVAHAHGSHLTPDWSSVTARSVMKRAVWVVLAVLFAGALFGCLGNQEIAAPSAGGGSWVELRSEHFSLVTDLSQRDAANVISEYEHVYRLLEQRLNQVLTRLEPLARSPQQLNLLAISELRKRDFGRADQFAKRAADVGPDCWECRHTRAQAAFLAGDAARALEYEQSALALTSEDTSVQALTAMRAGLRIYESVLRDPNAAGTGRQLPPLFVPN